MAKAGTSINAITATINGISTTRAAFIPPISLSAGTANGFIVMAMPLTNTRLKRFAPRIFPKEREACPLRREEMAVTSSGRDVPKAMNVRAITDSGTPSPVAMILPLSTRRFAPTAITAAPTIRRRISFHIGFPSTSFSISLSSSLSIFTLPDRA